MIRNKTNNLYNLPLNKNLFTFVVSMPFSITPFSLTNYCNTQPILAMEMSNHYSKTEQSAYSRLLCLVSATALRILDAVANLFLAILKLPVAMMSGLKFTCADIEECTFRGIGKNLKEFVIALISAPFASICGAIDPRFITQFVSPAEKGISLAKEDIGLSAYFDHAFVLNMAARADRRAHIRNHFTEIGITGKSSFFTASNRDKDAEMISALIEVGLIDESATDFEKTELLKTLSKRMQGSSEHNRKGALSCFLGHMRMIKEAKEKYASQNVIMFEDDVGFNEQSKTVIERHMKDVPKDCEILYLGSFYHVMHERVRDESAAFIRPLNALGTHAYMLMGRKHPEVCENMLQTMRAHLRGEPLKAVDRFYAKAQSATPGFLRPDGKPYSFWELTERVAVQVPSYSDLNEAYIPHART